MIDGIVNLREPVIWSLGEQVVWEGGIFPGQGSHHMICGYRWDSA